MSNFKTFLRWKNVLRLKNDDYFIVTTDKGLNVTVVNRTGRGQHEHATGSNKMTSTVPSKFKPMLKMLVLYKYLFISGAE